jgi:hypothetical protein
MIDRRKLVLAGVVGFMVPFAAAFAQPAPDERRDGPATDHGPDHPGPDHPGPAVDHGPDHPGPDHPGPDHARAERPHMPPPRHEDRPRPPGPEAYRWRDGHWAWSGNRWAWASGRWYR